MDKREERIERMYREKQERIARQIALREARETVTASPAIVAKDPEAVAGKIIKVAERYYRWLQGGEKGPEKEEGKSNE